MADVAWQHGALIEPAIEDEPEGDAVEIASLLDAAEDIVNAVVPETRVEVAREVARREGRIARWFRRGRPGGGHS